MNLKLGQTIDSYELLDFVDSSTERISFRVKNLETGQFEQLQVLPDSLQKDPERAERFLREIRILASLSHLNIVTCRGAVQIDGQWAMTTELTEGVTLAERLELGAMVVPEAVEFFRQILSAVACAHAHGVIHREITPRNILVTPDRVAKLTGFTYAKSPADLGLTQVGAIIGDVEYMSPEQVRGLGGLDGRSDIYSLGAVLYAMLTGKPAFHSVSQFDIMLAHVNQEPAPPSKLNPNVPAALDYLVLRALSKQAEQRFQSAQEFLLELDAVVAALKIEVGPAPVAALDPCREEAVGEVPPALLPEPPWFLPAVLFSVLFLIVAILAITQLSRGN